MDALFSSVIRLYEQENSLRQISKRLHISEQKARKILITCGMWDSTLSRTINNMFSSGKTQAQIAKELGMKEKTVNSYLPYTRGMQNAEYPSMNALRIRKYREKKKEK